MVRDLLRRKPLKTWRNYPQVRGMSPWHDLVDWVGGYPFEVPNPRRYFAFTVTGRSSCENSQPVRAVGVAANICLSRIAQSRLEHGFRHSLEANARTFARSSDNWTTKIDRIPARKP